MSGQIFKIKNDNIQIENTRHVFFRFVSKFQEQALCWFSLFVSCRAICYWRDLSGSRGPDMSRQGLSRHRAFPTFLHTSSSVNLGV